jgi:hypothetical protein
VRLAHTIDLFIQPATVSSSSRYLQLLVSTGVLARWH